MWWPIPRCSPRLLKITFAAILISGYGCIGGGRPGLREMRRCTERSEPVAAISNPPAQYRNGYGRHQRPQDRECEVRDQSKKNQDNPENLLFHDFNSMLRLFFPSVNV